MPERGCEASQFLWSLSEIGGLALIPLPMWMHMTGHESAQKEAIPSFRTDRLHMIPDVWGFLDSHVEEEGEASYEVPQMVGLDWKGAPDKDLCHPSEIWLMFLLGCLCYGDAERLAHFDDLMVDGKFTEEEVSSRMKELSRAYIRETFEYPMIARPSQG
jgi:hypothetical protein